MKQITLNIGGQDRVFYFGLGFLGNLIEKSGVGMNEIDSKISENPFKWIPEIMYHSLAFGYIRKNETLTFDAFDLAEWIDEEVIIDNGLVTSRSPSDIPVFCKKMIEVYVSEKHYLHTGSFKEQEDETMFDHLPFHDHSTFCH